METTYRFSLPSVRRVALRTAVVAAAAIVLMMLNSGAARAAAEPVPLGTASSFVVLAGSGVTATGVNVLNGDLGSYPTTSVMGPGTITVNGTDHGGDLVTQGAKTDLTAAFGNAAAQGPTLPIVADLAGQTLLTGVHNSASQILLSGTLTLDAQGDPNAIFVFQAGSDLIVGPGAVVSLVNGAQACNVYWQVGSSASLDTTVQFRGTIMALTSITANTGATVIGRLLAQNGTVTLDSNVITAPSCAVSPSGPVQTGDGSARATVQSSDPSVAQAAAAGLVAVGAIVAITAVNRTRRRDV